MKLSIASLVVEHSVVSKGDKYLPRSKQCVGQVVSCLLVVLCTPDILLVSKRLNFCAFWTWTHIGSKPRGQGSLAHFFVRSLAVHHAQEAVAQALHLWQYFTISPG